MNKAHSEDDKYAPDQVCFALQFILGFPLVGILWTFLIFYFSNSEKLNFQIAYWIGGVGLAIGIFCLLSSSCFHLISSIWHKLEFCINTFITLTTLSLFYYLLFSPFAYLLRGFGKATMKESSKNKTSFWNDVKQPSSLERYLRQF
jgi:hypothetical protein